MTALDCDEVIPYQYAALRDVARGARYPVWRIKASLAIAGWPKSGVPGAGGAEDVKPLVEALRDKDLRLRADAAHELGCIGLMAKDALPALTGALKDPDGLVRVRAAEAIAQVDLDNRDGLSMLSAALKDRKRGCGKRPRTPWETRARGASPFPPHRCVEGHRPRTVCRCGGAGKIRPSVRSRPQRGLKDEEARWR